MDLELSEDQKLFHETTIRFIESELPVAQVRLLHDDPTGFDKKWLAQAAELGWFSMLVSEEDGGGSLSGEGLLDACLVAEEIGRYVQPGPFFAMNVVAAAIAENGSPGQRTELLPSIVSGELIATWAIASEEGNWDAGAGVDAVGKGDSYTLTGTRGFVQDAQSADQLLVGATVGDRAAQFLVPADAPGVKVVPLVCLDLSRRMAEVSLAGVEVPASALVGPVGAEEAIERQLQIASVLLAAETVGALDAMFSMTVEYSKDRIAFGRPIGSFQALKHVMADAALYLETCKAGAVAAAKAVQARSEDAAEVVSMVSAYLGDMGTDISQECLQIHGGIGCTWEHDLHLFLRRVRSNCALYGESSWHRERVCTIHEL